MALKATPESQAALLSLQASDMRLQQLAHQTKTIPQLARLAELTVESERLRQQLLADMGAVEDARLELGRVESDVAVVEARMARDAERIAGSSSAKDVAGLEHEIESLRRRRDDLEEIQLGVMERLEGLEVQAEESKRQRDAVLEEIRTVEEERDIAFASIENERKHAQANRTEIAATIPDELLALYERQRERYGAGASHLRGGVSSASGVRLTESDMARIRAAAPDDVIMCPDSEAILVRTDESGL
ncbi:zinc ribbon domain-containing protein [Salinibacterium sp. GXW1014]|uniref:zinc ribbon domain-containing protein n=1 Tax=Salinibacterium sp. GXW1014 TaxID=3377838 RepID=UPI00383A4634